MVTLRDHPKPVKHLSIDLNGKYLTASCTDGIIYIYSLSDYSLFRKIDGVIKRLETSDRATSKCVWHPDGRAFACATATRDIQVVSVDDGALQRTFTGGHNGDITSLAWSSNGALLATSSTDDQLVVWQTKTQAIIKKHNYEKIINVTWNNQGENTLCWTNDWGELFIITDFLEDEAHVRLVKGPKTRAPFYHDPLDDDTARRPLVNGQKRRDATPDSLDEMLGPEPEDEYDWIEDDDNAGYTNGNGKRPATHLGPANGLSYKRSRFDQWQPQIHPSFQPSSTPWRGNRRYLCLNLLGFVWTVDQDTHHTITVEFYDREEFRDFHFTDPFLYDKACLNQNGSLFSCPPNNGQPSMIYYRPHETWTNRTDLRINLSDGEEVTSLALSTRYIVATTSRNYVRVWTLFGTPVRIWRMKSAPAVACSAHGDYVMTVANGAVGGDGCTQLVYSIEEVRHDETYQNEDLLALSTTAGRESTGDEDGATLKNIFWSDAGDPCIYDSSGILLTLLHWRNSGQAKWVPLLDTRQLERLKSGKKEETYWPVAVAGDKFHAIILKGGETSPYFPRPLLSEFDFNVPVVRPVEQSTEDDEGAENNAVAGARLEESYIRNALLYSLLDDQVQAQGDLASHSDKTELRRREIEIDKVLLQLLAVECREGEDRGMKALEVVKLLRDKTGRMVEAASKVAGRWGLTVLEDKIRSWAETRLQGMDQD